VSVTHEKGWSLQMLSTHYAYAIEDLRRVGPRSADVEWRAARDAQANSRLHERDQSATADHDEAVRRRKSLFAWLSARRQARHAL
jgi:hypothetical protein